MSKIPTPSGFHCSIYDFWNKGCVNLIDGSVLDIVLDLISEKHPEYYEVAKEFLEQKQHRGYNTFILRKELFHELCEFEFDILFELEKIIDTGNYSNLMLRTPGYIGEILSAIYLYKIEHDSKYKFSAQQLVAFPDCLMQEKIFLSPAFDKNNIPVVFVSSKSNLLYLSVCIESLLENSTQANNYDLIILSSEADKSDEKRFKEQIRNRKNVSVRFYNPYTLIPPQNFKININGYISLPYYKALLPWILPFHNQAIVLDSDIIIKTDIAKLLEIKIGDNHLAAVRDHVFMGLLNGIEAGWQEYTQNVLHLSNPYNYVNAGVLVMNLESIRKYMVPEKIIGVATQSDFKLADQDLINVVFQNKVHFLDPRWNLFVQTNWWVKACIEASAADYYRSYEQAKDSPYIIHYANSPKPWSEPSLTMASEWWSVARISLRYEELIVHLIDEKLKSLPPQVSSIHPVLSTVDNRSGARKIADILLPIGSKRRKFAKIILPKGSLRWRFCKQIYYIFAPQYRPKNAKKN